MLAKMKITAHKIDLFGRFLTLEENENQKFTTNIGVILTICLLIVSIVIDFIFGKEIYERKNPLVIQSFDKKDYSRISIKDFPFILGFRTGNSEDFPIDNYLDIYVASLSYDNETNFYSKEGKLTKIKP